MSVVFKNKPIKQDLGHTIRYLSLIRLDFVIIGLVFFGNWPVFHTKINA